MIVVKWWPRRPVPYQETFEAMKAFTQSRDAYTPDEIWLVEHDPVYTLGQAGKPEHVLNPGDIPLVKSDRGGQVTYHGPGQVVAYCLVDLRRLGIFVKEYVELLEAVVMGVLADYGLAQACRKPGAPGVYVPWPAVSAPSASGSDVELAKIAALGVKISRGCSYHGLALNVDMNLAPFLGINPCGYAGLRTVDMAACGVSATVYNVGEALAARLVATLQALPAPTPKP
ncbi:lipoyl(octanoyl) transferase LipB [Pusillimonas minor]|uniref:Octanoyltransferase n=1 Tax=Pusillimonas minor TaxID=2697024 RepID=A0A842HKS9_9BURK|nr:lipoyl(octanoyl) transferase LipB [Pusillimonas minor]